MRLNQSLLLNQLKNKEREVTEKLFEIMVKRIFSDHKNSNLDDIGTTKEGKPVNIFGFKKDFVILSDNTIGFDSEKCREIFGYIEARFGDILKPHPSEVQAALKLTGKVL